jgi:hypothetical protein
LLDHFPEWEQFVQASSLPQEGDYCFEVLRLPVRKDLGGHTLSVFDRGDTFEIAYDDTVARGPAEQQMVFIEAGPEEGALAVIEWLRDFINEQIVVERHSYRRVRGEPYTLIYFRRRDQKVKRPISVISWKGTYDCNAGTV